jgi:hypothetical protein
VLVEYRCHFIHVIHGVDPFVDRTPLGLRHAYLLGPRSPFACDHRHKTYVWYRATGGWNSDQGARRMSALWQKRTHAPQQTAPATR